MYGAGVEVFALWGYVIAHTVDSQVELNPDYLAPLLGTSPETVRTALAYLCAPDPVSRSKGHDGRRLIKEGEYAYRVPNHEHYRRIRDEADRREYMRTYQQARRAAPTPKTTTTRPPKLSDADWLAQLKADPTYAGLDIDRELGKCRQWCTTNSHVFGRKRAVNWLNRAERPLQPATLTKTQWRSRYSTPPPEDLPE